MDTLAQTQPDPLGRGVIDSEDSLRERWTGNYWQANASADYEPDARTQFTGSVRVSSNAFRTAYADRFTQDDPMDVLASALDDSRSRERPSYATGDALLSWRRSAGEAHDLTLCRESVPAARRPTTIASMRDADAAGWAGRVEPADPMRPIRLRRLAVTAWTMSARWLAVQLKLGYDFSNMRAGTRRSGRWFPADLLGHIVLDPSQRDVFQATETDNGAYRPTNVGWAGSRSSLGFPRGEQPLRARPTGRKVSSASHDYPRLLPNLHLAYDLGGGRQLTASYSWRTNSPTDHQLDPFVLSRDPLHQQAGNPDLRPDDQAQLRGASKTATADRTLTVTLFYHRRQNEMNEVYSNLPDGAYLEETLNAGKGQRVGAEMTRWTPSCHRR